MFVAEELLNSECLYIEKPHFNRYDVFDILVPENGRSFDSMKGRSQRGDRRLRGLSRRVSALSEGAHSTIALYISSSRCSRELGHKML